MMSSVRRGCALALVFLSSILGAGPAFAESAGAAPDLRRSVLYNETAYIPPQCYTKTTNDKKQVTNNCYVCHTRSREPNYLNDHDLQLTFSLPGPALTNPWRNLFEDRRERVAAVSDEAILAYIGEDNYRNAAGRLVLAERLATPPAHWDANGNGRWDGFTPDCYFNFDPAGFDRGPDGQDTGWRAFAYYPFPGTYWPTNGSTDDLMIRLAEELRQDGDGRYDRESYRVNLAIVEALIKRRSVSIDPVEEARFDVDLDKDGRIGRASSVVFDWAPLKGRTMSFVGRAKSLQAEGRLHLAAGLFPEGTEFLQSVRYVGVDEGGRITLAPRMKELRYMRKRAWQTYADLEEQTLAEVKERDDFPDRIRQIIGNAEQGVNNGSGWILQGFIEDREGRLRPQSFEETVSCIGCHGGVGATTDGVFGFPRKLEPPQHQNGWYHWSQKGWEGLVEPKIEIRGSGVFYEYAYYLMYNRSASEFRDNPEVETRFFNADGTIRQDRLDRLHEDIATLLNPSRERALNLNKAYRTIVEDQDFHLGRDANLSPVKTVHENVAQDLLTGVTQPTSIQQFGGRFGAACGTAAEVGATIDPSVAGRGMAGPSGIPYEVDWQGVIHKSRYAVDLPGVHFTFPRRLTLPTRLIVPVGSNPSCLTCHRMAYPTVPDNRSLLSPEGSPGPVREKEGGDLRRLTTDTGQDQNGQWSPDGSRIAFVSDRSGSAQIWLMDADGSRQRQLSQEPAIHGWPKWHPDGKTLVVWSYDPSTATHGIKTIEVDSGREHTLVASREMLDRPEFHPDGERIAYAAETGGNWDIWCVRAADGETNRLTTDPQMESNPLWSPDGKILAFKVAPATGAYNLTGQYFMTFETGVASPTIHPWQGPESVQMNHWSPDGSQIAYTAEAITDAAGYDQVSYLAMVSDLNLEGGKAAASPPRLMAGGCTLGDRGPVFSPDGRRVVFWSWTRDNMACLWLHDLETGRSSALTRDGLAMVPQWRPDGKALLFESRVDGQMDLMTLSITDP